MNKILLSPREVMAITGLGRTTCYGLIRSGALPVVRVGRLLLVRLDTLEKWLSDHEAPYTDPVIEVVRDVARRRPVAIRPPTLTGRRRRQRADTEEGGA